MEPYQEMKQLASVSSKYPNYTEINTSIGKKRENDTLTCEIDVKRSKLTSYNEETPNSSQYSFINEHTDEEAVNEAYNDNVNITIEEYPMCTYCDARFPSIFELTQHIELHIYENPFSCKQCKKRFKEENELLKHSNTYNSRKHFSCNYCEAVFPNSNELSEHNKIHTKEEIVRNIDKTTSKNSNNTTLQNQFYCNLCDAGFLNRTLFTYHSKLHKNEKSFEPENENISLYDYSSIEFNEHKFSIAPELYNNNNIQIKPIVYCSTPDTSSVNNYFTEEPFNDVCEIPCDVEIHIEGAPFPDNKEDHGTFEGPEEIHLNFNRKSNQENSNGFSCKICGRQYTEKCNLLRHMRNSHDKIYLCRCVLCFKIFSSGELSKHIRLKHAEKNPYSCEYCFRRFRLRHNMDSHMKKEHSSLTNKRKFPCRLCDKSFTCLEHVKMHSENVHVVVKSYSCELCNKYYKIKEHLIYHIRSSHNMEFSNTRNITNVLHCALCNENYQNDDEITKHIEYHAGDKAFCCKQCGLHFLRKRNVLRHIKNKHSPSAKTKCYRKDNQSSAKKTYVSSSQADKQKNPKLQKIRKPSLLTKQVYCTLCDKNFGQNLLYRLHVENFHVVNKPFSCQHCGNYFALKEHLVYHRRTIHSTLIHNTDDDVVKDANDSDNLISALHCQLCNKNFNTLHEIGDHIEKKHSSEKPFACRDCGVHFIRKRNVLRHFETIHEKEVTHKIRQYNYSRPCGRKNYCSLCWEYFSTDELYRLHVGKCHIIEKPYSCLHCNSNFALKDHLAFHIHNIHMNRLQDVINDLDNNLYCPLCDIHYNTSDETGRHIEEIHNGTKPYSCRNCDLHFMRRRNVFRHIRNKHETASVTSNDTFTMNSIFDSFTTNSILNDSSTTDTMVRATPKANSSMTNEKTIPCTMCDKYFATDRLLKMHIGQMHTTDKQFSCDYCGNTFTRRDHLRRHVKTIHANPSKNSILFCAFCDLSFDSLDSVRIHIENNHITDKWLPCELCGNHLPKVEFTRHMQNVHMIQLQESDEKTTFNCKFCGENCASDEEVKVHMDEKHNSDKPYECQFCSSTFTRRYHLNRHVKSLHAAELEQTSMQHCFSEENSMDNTDELSCHICNWYFTKKEDLDTHLNLAHKICYSTINSGDSILPCSY